MCTSGTPRARAAQDVRICPQLNERAGEAGRVVRAALIATEIRAASGRGTRRRSFADFTDVRLDLHRDSVRFMSVLGSDSEAWGVTIHLDAYRISREAGGELEELTEFALERSARAI